LGSAARIIEYHRAWAANREQFPPIVAPIE
jgi:hypothetical protein